MAAPYNRFSGQSLERIQALSDGVFAVALTLLVLDLRVPVGAADSDLGLGEALSTLEPSFVAYLLSFTMLGTFWLAQHTFLGLCVLADRALTWTQLGFLIVVTLLPFSASLLAEYVTVRLAVGVYWVNLLLLGVGLAIGSRHAAGAGLVDPPQLRSLQIFRRRIWFAQSWYAVEDPRPHPVSECRKNIEQNTAGVKPVNSSATVPAPPSARSATAPG